MFWITRYTYLRLQGLRRFLYKQAVNHRRDINTPSRRVLVSTSDSIFENLALETWLFEHANLEKESVLLMWRNSPAVVCGRHQNPWLECNVPEALKLGVSVARRNSGGGTVYHDRGNLNCSFVMHSSLYNRKKNLELVVSAIKTGWPKACLEINRREDIILDGRYKISGTASKLSGKRTYHHFTVMFDVNRTMLENILASEVEGATSNATESVRGRVANLSEYLPGINFNSLVGVISDTYLQNNREKCVQHVSPVDAQFFPNVKTYYNEYSSWEWVYGKTPNFSIRRTFRNTVRNVDNSLNVHVTVQKGAIHGIDIDILQKMGVDSAAFSSLRLGLEGQRLERVAIAQALSQVKMGWIYHKLYRVETREVLDWVLLCLLETFLQFTGTGDILDSQDKETLNSL